MELIRILSLQYITSDIPRPSGPLRVGWNFNGECEFVLFREITSVMGYPRPKDDQTLSVIVCRIRETTLRNTTSLGLKKLKFRFHFTCVFALTHHYMAINIDAKIFVPAVVENPIREAFLSGIGDLVFRRVGRLYQNAPKVLRVTKITDAGQFDIRDVSESNAHTLTPEEYDQNVSDQCSSYFFFTRTTPLRENDSYPGTVIKGSRGTKCYLLPGPIFALESARREKDIMPRIDDLVCGFVHNTDKGLAFTKWMICSEQFFRAWTAIKYPDHESLSKKVGDDDQKIRRYLMSGNRLCTNSYFKWRLGMADQELVPTIEEQRTRMYVLRTEPTSRDYVHVYAALVLLIRYGELPDDTNVPNNLNDDPKIKKWNLPQGWLEGMVAYFGIDGEKMKLWVDDEPEVLNVGVIKALTGSDLSAEETAKLNLNDVNEFPTL